jgi:hypothetical protein
MQIYKNSETLFSFSLNIGVEGFLLRIIGLGNKLTVQGDDSTVEFCNTAVLSYVLSQVFFPSNELSVCVHRLMPEYLQITAGLSEAFNY